MERKDIEIDDPTEVGDPMDTNSNSDSPRLGDDSDSPTDPNEKSSKDYYFDSYSHFGIHEEMLKDTVRTKTYMRAIKSNPQLFRDKIVLDIGAGTGILSLFAAQSGARHVYAIECADIARHAQVTIEENGFADKITVIQKKVEEIESLSGVLETADGDGDASVVEDIRVDVIISEWMGYFLLYESMLDTVLYARDKWLKPGGVLLPDMANLYICGVEDGEYMDEKINFWNDVYGFRMPSLREEAMKEPLVDVVDGTTMVTSVAPILEIDLNTVTKEDLDFESSFSIEVLRDDHVHAFVSFFDVVFSRTHTRIGFTTSPRADYTHWKQTVFLFGRVVDGVEGYTAEWEDICGT